MEDTYSTKDLHFAAFLQLRGCKITDLQQNEKEGRKSLYFVFEDRQKCLKYDDIFWNSTKGEEVELQINVKEYVSIIRDLRSRVFAATKSS